MNPAISGGWSLRLYISSFTEFRNSLSAPTVGVTAVYEAPRSMAPAAALAVAALPGTTMQATFLTGLILAIAPLVAAYPAEPASRPNFVFILADDLGYGDLGCYGQQRILTPALDRLAAEGLRFTQFYAGSTVCAPSRCALLTGLHTGHARVRGNALVPLEPDDVTLAEVLGAAGYEPALVGKWGLGEPETTGIPTRQGFDQFFGYLNQQHAHNYYPDYLWRNERRVPIAGNVVRDGVATARAEYSHDLLTTEALRFLDAPHEQPFFLYPVSGLYHSARQQRGRRGRNGGARRRAVRRPRLARGAAQPRGHDLAAGPRCGAAAGQAR
jgi:arylsulfatase A-like enzyme